jgi:chromosome segregation ATPase
MRHAAIMAIMGIMAALLTWTGAPLQAQPAAGGGDPVAVELAKLNATLKDIALLLRQQGESGELELLIKRVELAETRLAERERALAAAEAEQRSLDGERSQLELSLEMIAAQAERGGGELPDTQAEAMTAQTEAQLRRVRQRTAELAREIAGLENAIASQAAEVQSWKSILDRRLGAR